MGKYCRTLKSLSGDFMSKKVVYLLLALIINFILAFIVARIRRGNLPVDINTLAYISGYALIYWLRPFLFVALTRLFFLMTNRSFTDKVALSAYAIAWGVMLVGMFYF
jgi:hypothetical protein